MLFYQLEWSLSYLLVFPCPAGSLCIQRQTSWTHTVAHSMSPRPAPPGPWRFTTQTGPGQVILWRSSSDQFTRDPSREQINISDRSKANIAFFLLTCSFFWPIKVNWFNLECRWILKGCWCVMLWMRLVWISSKKMELKCVEFFLPNKMHKNLLERISVNISRSRTNWSCRRKSFAKK